MHSIRKRFTAYALIGLFFGILDWFYLDWLAHFQWGALSESLLVIPFILLMNYGIWVKPGAPVRSDLPCLQDHCYGPVRF